MEIDPLCSEVEQMRITGVMVQYYISCQRELWFYSHGINMNYEDDNILIGRLLHETTFKREKRKNIIIADTIAIDFASSKDGVVVFEVKKSTRLTKPARYQLLYYLHFLEEMGIENVNGVLVYPKERKREVVELTNETKEELNHIISDIERIVLLETPPSVEKLPYCRKCSYHDFCRV